MTTTTIAYGSPGYVELLHKLRAQLSLRADQLYVEIQASDAPVRLWEQYSDLEICYFGVCDELDRFDPNMAPIYQEERQRIKTRAKTFKP
jgi:hypothetical protein